MAFKEFVLNEHTKIKVYKRRNSRSLRLTIAANGEVRVSIPLWVPYKAGVQFAQARADWIQTQRPVLTILHDGQPIGKAHHLRFVADENIPKPSSRLRSTEAVVFYPATLDTTHPSVQKAAQAVSLRALKAQAEALLPNRLAELAERHGFSYRSVSVRQLKSRWGSCDTQKNIVLNFFLMQLPWDCIDYVLMHELIHTQVMQHGPNFWTAFERILPNAKQLRRTLHGHQPALQ